MKRNLFPHHNRIKPKANGKNKDKQLHDKGFLKWLHEVKQPPCFICGERNGIELHHIKGGSMDTKNDQRVIPLCGEKCHRNGKVLSAHGTPKLFRETFSITDQEIHALELHIEYLESKRVNYE